MESVKSLGGIRGRVASYLASSDGIAPNLLEPLELSEVAK